MLGLGCIFDLLGTCTAYLVVAIIVAHLLMKIIGKKQSVKLDKDSFVVLTGGCMGIGRQMAVQMARLYKCSILVIDRRRDLFAETIAQVTEAGGTCECRETDLGNEGSVSELTNFILGKNKKIDMFLYNAGVMIPKTAWQTSEQQHRLVMNVNYFTPTFMIKKLEPLLLGNHIAVVVSMMAIIDGGIHVSSYCASKHALFAYLSSLRQEYKKFGKNITISMGCPYAINTTMFSGFRTKLDILIRVLDEKYVAQRLVKEFIEKKDVCFMYLYEALFFKIMSFFPSQIVDWAALHLDVSRYTPPKKTQ